MESAVIRTAIIGFGTSGSVFHAPLVQNDAAFVVSAIVTSSPARVAIARAKYPEAAIYESFDALIREAEKLDLVVLSTPNTTHAELARKALMAGLHVVIDKPVAVHAEDAVEIVSDAKSAGRIVTVFQNRRWDGDFLTVKDVVSSKALGDVIQFETAIESWKPRSRSVWKQQATSKEGGGLVYDLGAHLVDQALQLFGSVQAIHAELDQRRTGVASDDDSFLTLHHVTGVRSRIWMSSLAISPRPRFRVVGTKGVLTIKGTDPQEAQLASGMDPGTKGFGARATGDVAVLETLHDSSRIDVQHGRYVDLSRSGLHSHQCQGCRMVPRATRCSESDVVHRRGMRRT